MPYLRPAPDGAGTLIRLRVRPRSARTAVLGVMGLAGNLPAKMSALKVALTDAPVDGQANKALVRFLGKLLKVPPSHLEIRRGVSGRDKEIFVPGLTPDEVREILG